jgi:hypothetical protein
MTTNGSRKRARPTVIAEPSPAAKRNKPEEPTARGSKRAKKEKATKIEAEEPDYAEPGSDAAAKSKFAKPKRQKRVKSLAEPVAAMPAFARTLNAKVLIGAHVSAAGGIATTPWLPA